MPWPEGFRFVEGFLPDPQANRQILLRLRESVPFKQETLTLFGREHPMPRLTAWFGDPGCSYTYSGLRNAPQPWTAELAALRRRLEDVLGVAFNSVLLNWYRSGRDGMGWHSDDERELGERPVIASLSLGQPRRFRLRHRETRETRSFELGCGSLLVMSERSQREWEHSVPKTAREVGARLNLTFRRVEPADAMPDRLD